MNYFENLVAMGVIAMTKKSIQAIVIIKKLKKKKKKKKKAWVWVWVKFERRENKMIDVVRQSGKLRWEKKRDRHGIEKGNLVQFEGNKPQNIQFHFFHNKF